MLEKNLFWLWYINFKILNKKLYLFNRYVSNFGIVRSVLLNEKRYEENLNTSKKCGVGIKKRKGEHYIGDIILGTFFSNKTLEFKIIFELIIRWSYIAFPILYTELVNLEQSLFNFALKCISKFLILILLFIFQLLILTSNATVNPRGKYS